MSACRIGLGSLFLATAFLWAGGCGGGGGGAPPQGGGGLPGGGQGGLAGILSMTTSNRSAATESEPNDTLGQPDELGQLLVGQRITIFGNVAASTDPMDGFRLRCPQRAVVSATLTFSDVIPNNLALRVYDPMSLQIVEDFPVPTGVSQASFVARGTFDVVVVAFAGATEYRLDLALSVVPTGFNEREPNDIPAQGQYTGALYPGETLAFFGSAHPLTDIADVWLVPFPLAATLNLEFDWPAFSNYDLDVLDGTNNVGAPTPMVTFAGTGPSRPLQGSLTVTSGTLLVLRIRPLTGNGGSWKVTLRPVAPPPGTPKPGLTEGRRPASLDLEAERLPGLEARYGRVALELVEGEILVGCADETRGDASVEGANGTELARIPGGARRVRVPLASGLPKEEAARATLGAALALDGAPGVRYAGPNQVRRAYETPNDPLYDLQWHYEQIHLPEAWDITTGSSTVIVAVLDTGSTPHPDLQGQQIAGYDFVSDANNAEDGNGYDADPTDSVYHSSFHGTHVAGTIGARSDNGEGVAGVAWGVSIMPVRVLGWWGGTDFDIANAILFAARLSNVSGQLPAQRAHVINMSLGGGGFDQTLQNACTAAHNAGVVVIAASGNESSSSVGYPAANANVIAVGATDALGQRVAYSNYGQALDLMAPGGDFGQDATGDGFADGVLSTLWDDFVSPARGIYEYMQGTSMATPHVAGVAALILSVRPDSTPDEVEEILTTTTQGMGTPGYDLLTGWGLLDAYRAVNLANLPVGVPPPVAPADLHFNVTKVEFGAVDSSRDLPITNFGTDFLTLEAPLVVTSNGGAWLTATRMGPATFNTNCSALRLLVSRAGLAPGGYSAEVQLTSDGGDWTLKVTMVVLPGLPPLPVIPLRLFVSDANTGQVVRFVDIDANGSYAWDIPQIPIGQYLLTAGTDLDRDGSYEDDGEYVGAWPSLDQPQMIEIGIGQTIPGLRLTVSPRTSVEVFGSAKRR